MRHFLTILIVILSVGSTLSQELDSATVKAEHHRIEASFEQIFARLGSFFETKQKLVAKQENSRSSSGFVAYAVEVTCKKIAYSLSNTKDPAKPYLAEVSLSITTRTNAGCGTVSGDFALGPKAGWDNIESAIENMQGEKCYKASVSAKQRTVYLLFYNDKTNWRFEKALSPNRKELDLVLTQAFGGIGDGIPAIENASAKAVNEKWQQLVQ